MRSRTQCRPTQLLISHLARNSRPPGHQLVTARRLRRDDGYCRRRLNASFAFEREKLAVHRLHQERKLSHRGCPELSSEREGASRQCFLWSLRPARSRTCGASHWYHMWTSCSKNCALQMLGQDGASQEGRKESNTTRSRPEEPKGVRISCGSHSIRTSPQCHVSNCKKHAVLAASKPTDNMRP